MKIFNIEDKKKGFSIPRGKILTVLLILLMVLSIASCGKQDASSDDEKTEESNEVQVEETDSKDSSDSAIETTSYTGTIPDEFSERDFRTSYEDYETIALEDGNTNTTAKSGVTVSGDTITIAKDGTYLLTGTLTDGQIVIDVDSADDKVQLVLDNASITNSNSAAIYVKSADKVFVTTTSGSVNTIATSGEFIQTDDNNVDGAIFSKDDIVFNGEGTLNIVSTGHGIAGKDDVKFTSGTYTITSEGKAVQGKDAVLIAGGDITLDAATDGIKTVNFVIYDGTLNIHAGDDGISAVVNEDVSDAPGVRLEGGTITITSGDDGLQTDGDVTGTGTVLNILAGGGYENAAEHYGDAMFGQMGGWGGMGQGGPMYGGDMDPNGEINYDTDDDESISDSSRNKGIKAANVSFTESSVTIDAQDDGINTSNDVTIDDSEININAGDDGIHADYHLTINSGKVNIENSWEGLEATIIVVNDGEIYVYAQDDGFNAAQKVSGETPQLEINGGTVTVDMAQGDTDALDSNGTLYINGGTINLNCQSPFDYDMDGAINGGTVYVYGEQVTEIYNQFMGGGMGGQGGGMGGHGGGWGRP